MVKKEGIDHGLVNAESKLCSPQDARKILTNGAGKDTKDNKGISADEDVISDAVERPATVDHLLSEAEGYKDRGNVEFYKGKVLAKHTAGKNLLRDACILYAEGLQALAKADAQLAADRILLSQPTLQAEEDQQRFRSGAADNLDEEATPSQEQLAEKEKFDPASATSPSPGVASRSTRLSRLASLSSRADKVRPSLYLNLAACNLLLQEWTPAIACCTHVLDECCGDALHALETGTAPRRQGEAGATAAGGGGGVPPRGGSSTASSAGDAGARRDVSATRSASEKARREPVPAAARATTSKPTAAAAATERGAASAATADAAAAPSSATRAQQHRQGEERAPGDKGSSRTLPGGEGEASGAQLGPQEGEEEAGRSRRREIAAKGLYRRAAAQVGSGNFSAAREDLVRALRLKPRDAAIGRELRKVEKKLAEDVARDSLRRETEEGRRRRQQQPQRHQQQQQQHHHHQQRNPSLAATEKATGAGSADGKSIGTHQLARSAAPRADHAVLAGGAGGDDGSGKCFGEGSAAARNEQASGGDLVRGQEQHGENQGPQPRQAKEEEDGQEEERNGGSRAACEEEFPTENGGVCRDDLYAWNQSVREVQVCVRIPSWARASDLRVDIRRKRLSVSVVPRGARDGNGGDKAGTSARANLATAGGAAGAAVGVGASARGDDGAGTGGGATDVVLAGGLSRPVQADECLWTVEEEWPGRVLLYLQKELPPVTMATAADGRGGEAEEPGFEWWASVMEGDPEIDVSKCDAGSDTSKYPEHVRRRGAKALWEHQQKSPEEKLKEERMREARRQMEEEAEERQRDLEKALKDPKKAELYRQLRETMPETSISIK